MQPCKNLGLGLRGWRLSHPSGPVPLRFFAFYVGGHTRVVVGGGERVEGSFGEKLGEARFKGRKMFFCCDFDGKAGSQGK